MRFIIYLTLFLGLSAPLAPLQAKDKDDDKRSDTRRWDDEDDEDQETHEIIITSDKCEARSERSKTGSTDSVIKKGSRVVLKGKAKDGFIRGEIDGRTVYIPEEQCSKVKKGTAAPTATKVPTVKPTPKPDKEEESDEAYVIATGECEIYHGNSYSSKVEGEAKKGQRFPLRGVKDKGFYKIEYKGHSSFIPVDCVNLDEDAPGTVPVPTSRPTAKVTVTPDEEPTPKATPKQTPQREEEPTEEPTPEPTALPTKKPTLVPTEVPTDEPTPEPTAVPTKKPTLVPTEVPTEEPTPEPTAVPTKKPTLIPTEVPTEEPTRKPTLVPTEVPTEVPTAIPTRKPTLVPTEVPTDIPTAKPTAVPTTRPTDVPTAVPTAVPTQIVIAKVNTPLPTRVPTRVYQPPYIPTPRPTATPRRYSTPWPTPVATPRARRQAQPRVQSAPRPHSQGPVAQLYLPVGGGKHMNSVMPAFKPDASAADVRSIDSAAFAGLGVELRMPAKWLRLSGDWTYFTHNTLVGKGGQAAPSVNVPAGNPAIFPNATHYKVDTHAFRAGAKLSLPGARIEPWVNGTLGLWAWNASYQIQDGLITGLRDGGLSFGATVGTGVDFHFPIGPLVGSLTPFLEWGAPTVNPTIKNVAGGPQTWTDTYGTVLAPTSRLGLQFAIGL